MAAFRFTPTTAADAGFDIAPLAELTTLFRTIVGNGNLPGAVLLLARGDKVVLHEAIGRGDLDDPTPLATDAIYRLYSMTKPLTAVAMLLLHEQGLWDLDDPVSKHLPEFEGFASQPGSRASREPTLRELFTHSGGLSYGETLEEVMANVARLDFFGTASLAELVGKYATLPPLYEPGARYEYGVGMDLQALIVQRLTGRRYDRFLEERLFGPLGMADTAFSLTPAQLRRQVPGYALDAETGRLRHANPMEMQEIDFPIGGSSFRSTALDYARFARMLLNRGSLGDVRVLKPESVDLMVSNLASDQVMQGRASATHYVIGGGNGHGMNGMVCVDPTAAGRPVGKGTYEWAGAHGTFFWADPEHDIVFVAMTNRAMPHPEMAPLSLVAQDLVYRALRT